MTSTDDMPWVIGLTDEEVQQLRTNKQQLTEYGKQKIRELMKNKHPANDWEWSEDAENGFVEWFNSDCGPYTWKCEYFYGDCEVEDEKTRKDLMYKWAHAAYVSGYERGLYGRMKQLAEIERKDLIDYALEELNAIVLGGQNTREFYLSVSHIRNVLERLK